jgi:hypothetical protein
MDDLEINLLHSGIRFMDGKHMFLVDHHNFYSVDPKTGNYIIYKGKNKKH